MNTQRVEGHTPTLKSCPFCGGPAIISEHRETVGHGETATSAVITCGDWERKGCGATVSGLAENLHEPDSRRAIQKWNRRASIERLEKVNEALVRLVEEYVALEEADHGLCFPNRDKIKAAREFLASLAKEPA